MGQGKSPWYTHRLMHRKRVTSELHDSYFRLMTIKHAIPKIEWAIELLYNSVWAGSQWVGDQMSWRQVVVEKASRKLSPRASGWASGERERHTAMFGGAGEVSMLQSLFGLQHPLTRKPFNKVRGIFFKEVFPRLYYHVIMNLSAWICIWVYIRFTLIKYRENRKSINSLNNCCSRENILLRIPLKFLRKFCCKVTKNLGSFLIMMRFVFSFKPVLISHGRTE